ncbi:MAG: right-handed parallel beta-helix repeat-containing protein, partial [Spirochaetes bacterium]|nr:right-handed parallel beta-helix repeat-containing protein [Spirochaetota bacterium]
MVKGLTLVFIIFLLYQPVQAAYYVDDDIGSDLNPGTFSLPFATIQQAVDISSSGITSSTCFVYPGIYTQSVTISSNKNSGYLYISKLSNDSPLMTGNQIAEYGFKITNTSRLMIMGFTLCLYQRSGIFIGGSSTNNIILKNTTYSNGWYGIWLWEDNLKNNFILTNNTWGNTSYNIQLSSCDNNFIMSNYIHNSQDNGMGIMGTATNNFITRNIVYSNDWHGIHVNAFAYHNHISSNNIYGRLQFSGIFLEGADRNFIYQNRYHHGWAYGIYLRGDADSNRITGNIMCSNMGYGIYLTDSAGNTADNNFIASNLIWSNTASGVHIERGDNNIIFTNAIHHSMYGISIENDGTNNRLIKNLIFSNNSGSGIHIYTFAGVSPRHNYILTNYIYGSQIMGIEINDAYDSVMEYNRIFDNGQLALYIKESTNGIFRYNMIHDNNLGILYTNSYSTISLNSITNNTYGVYFKSSFSRGFAGNNLQKNSSFAVINSSPHVKLTNNWFGTTSAGGIASMISNHGGYSNFIPYRLFGPFDTTGGDTTTLPKITILTSYTTNLSTVILRWQRTTGGDFTKYNVYHTTNTSLWSNLSFNDVFTQINSISQTNITNYNVPTGRYYYFVTSLDDPGSVFTNESWYSPPTTPVITFTPHSGPFYVDVQSGNDINYPGSFSYPFKSIQKASDVISAGVSSSICYIFPGTYNEKITIKSNKNNNFMVLTKLSNDAPVITGSYSSNYMIKLTNASKVMIKDLIIKASGWSGIMINGNASNNWIVGNRIYSNNNDAILIQGENADNNYVLSNHMWGTTIDWAIVLWSGDNNIIKSNYIHNNAWDGIQVLGTSKSNIIIHNTIYSNDWQAIRITSDDADDNIIMYNDLWGLNQDIGIHIREGDNNIVRSNRIHHNENHGIYFFNSSTRNILTQNEIFSNNLTGIYLFFSSANDNVISSNHIWGMNQDNGIVLDGSHRNRIVRNLIHDNQYSGIAIRGASEGSIVINNTISGSIFSNGVIWENTSFGTMYNNIIVYNGNATGDYGIQKTSTGTVLLAFNDLFGNVSGPTNGTFTWGNGNIFQDPLIDPVTFFLSTNTSPAADSGTNIAGISDIFYGPGPDMGWKEYYPPVPLSVGLDLILPPDIAVYPNYLDLSTEQIARIVFGISCQVE